LQLAAACSVSPAAPRPQLYSAGCHKTVQSLFRNWIESGDVARDQKPRGRGSREYQAGKVDPWLEKQVAHRRFIKQNGNEEAEEEKEEATQTEADRAGAKTAGHRRHQPATTAGGHIRCCRATTLRHMRLLCLAQRFAPTGSHTRAHLTPITIPLAASPTTCDLHPHRAAAGQRTS
jgi:hypothetical protein